MTFKEYLKAVEDIKQQMREAELKEDYVMFMELDIELQDLKTEFNLEHRSEYYKVD